MDYEISIQKPETKQQAPHSENPYNDNETMSTDYPVMLQAMSDAVKLREELGVEIDINKLGVTLFLRRVRA